MRALSLLLLLAMPVLPQPKEFVSNVNLQSGPLNVTMINYEVTKDRPYLIVHFEIRNPSDQDERCDWLALARLERPDGTEMYSNYDVMVDAGTGGVRATGPFVVAQRRKARASLLFVLGPQDLPGHLILPDGRRSARIDFRGKVRWTD